MAKILVIEDETVLREDIIEWLSYEGFEAIGAADGVEGVNAAVLHQPDLIVCDINMPRLDGFGVLVDVQADSTMRLTPFIFLTAKAELDDMRRGMQLGADDYLTKPFDRADLLRAIETRLEKKAVLESEQQQQIELFKEVLTYERAQRLLQTKLVATFSHEFRDSLSVIQLANTLLRDFVHNKDTSRSLVYVDRIEAYVGQIFQMLDDMLLLAQMEAVKFTLKPEFLSLETFLQKIVEEFQSIHGTTRQIILESRFHDLVMIDARLLRQIATNLISVALKSSRPGSEIRIALDSCDGQVSLTVLSQGMLIAEADQQHLVDTLQRDLEEGNLSAIELGLAIVKQASVAHGGNLGFEDKLDVGTNLIVTLPLHQA
ncbi:MAG: response regulator [Anaerolineae bacterium]|nr:response regulator [Anaerolineae bacterium]